MDVIITDENFRLAANWIQNYGGFLYLHLAAYEWILNQISGGTIQDQNICEALNKMTENLKGIKETIKSSTELIGQWSNDFILQIDEADQFLYGK